MLSWQLSWDFGMLAQASESWDRDRHAPGFPVLVQLPHVRLSLITAHRAGKASY